MNKNRLFLTYDCINDDAYYARTAADKFARFVRNREKNGGWTVWFYPYKTRRTCKTLARALNVIENSFKRWVDEIQH